MTSLPEVGPAGDIPDAHVVDVMRMVRTGRRVSLSVPRFPGMPLFPGHPPFQVTNFRTPQGMQAEGANPWGTPNDIGLAYMAEVVSGTSHSGAHVDALAHMTVGPDGEWFGGARATEHLSDRGPTVGDAAKLPAIVTRGVLLDVPRHRGVDRLPGHEAVDAAELAAVADVQGTAVGQWDVVLVRTGYLGLWPDEQRMREHLTAGPDLSAADWLVDRGVVAVGSDTETFEVQPTPTPGVPSNPQPVHTRLLIEEGIYIMESLYLEELAAAGIHEFVFIALPLKIEGATGSMIDPLALV